MTREQKEKAYDKALERAKDYVEKQNPPVNVLYEIFPELKESKDERIRKALIRFHKSTIDVDGIKGEDILAWLEKQGKQKPADKVEPKFKVDDWVASNICNSSDLLHIIDVDDKDYEVEIPQGNTGVPSISYIDNNFHLWTIQDAKDGDVLSDGTTIFIFKDLLSDGSVMSYCDYDTDSGESDAFCPLSVNLMCSKITPTTKEQRDLLFQKMKEAGYEWDAEKKELKKISQRMISAEAKEAMYDKPAWSEKDDKMINKLLAVIQLYYDRDGDDLDRQSCISWLKSLRPQKQ